MEDLLLFIFLFVVLFWLYSWLFTSKEPQPESQPEPQPEPKSEPQVLITNIFYDGEVKRVESDEYIEIANQGNAPADLSGWRINADDVDQDFYFPNGTLLQPGKRFRVYTDEVHPEWGGFSLGIKRAIWNNKGDEGQLYDAEGNIVSNWRY
ncbi:MAG: lamin tail domain-containing protein [Xenococcaceae cyanobacterium]